MAWTSTTEALERGLRESIELHSEEVADDSDKSFVVATDGNAPAYEVLGIRLEIATDATVGNRDFDLEVQDSASDVVFNMPLSAATTLAASSSLNVELVPDAVNRAAINGMVIEYMPRGLFLRTGDSLRIRDRAAVAAAGDDIIIHLRLRGISPHSS
jgi:hypothetical protein